MYYYKLTVAYDGSHYCGFQVQANGITIQEKLMEAAKPVFYDDVTMTGASRTDAGVHARGQVVLMKSLRDMPPIKVLGALNAHLPSDIVVVDVEKVSESFHPRYGAKAKTYRYQIVTRQAIYPWEKPYVYHYRQSLDIERMKEAAGLMVGTHDFESYSSSNKSVTDTIRTVTHVDLSTEEGVLTMEVSGNGFLYNMVRIMVGTLIEVGSGRMTLEQVAASLRDRNRQLAGPTAPASGLILYSIEYEL